MQPLINLDHLLGQQLCGLEAFTHNIPAQQTQSVLRLGLALHLADTALVCLSAPAYRHASPPQPRLRYCNREGWELYRQLPEMQREVGRWLILPVSRFQARMGQMLLSASSSESAMLTLQFSDEPCEIRWRAELGGYIELAPAGIRHTLSTINPAPDNALFGWLSPG
ncbi:hypothetical protein [Niveibacterium terrae]|uniref:hypothetical protein n=1 Tax=Niveibacterium terrae TaxID=3373598 RepID=UPI003A95C3CE